MSAKQLITPLSALKNLNNSIDACLVDLDEATEHFQDSVISTELVDPETLAKVSEQERANILQLLESYSLLAGFLLEHPLITLIRQIRDESKIAESDAVVMHIRTGILVGQKYRHYKGTIYTVVSVARNSNHPTIDNIHYTAGDDVWELPAHEFCKRVFHEGKMISRFTFIPA